MFFDDENVEMTTIPYCSPICKAMFVAIRYLMGVNWHVFEERWYTVACPNIFKVEIISDIGLKYTTLNRITGKLFRCSL